MSDFQKEYKRSDKGLLYVAPTGSGKTRQALKATKGESTTVVGTASLTKNFDKEEKKAFKTVTPREGDTYSGVARGHALKGTKNLVLDESHYIRNPGTKAFKGLKGQRKKFDKVLAMTATPMINEPFDIASQVNLVTGKNVVPANKKDFYKLFYKDVKVHPSMKQRLGGVTSGDIKVLRSPDWVKYHLDKHVYQEPAGKFKKLMPKRNEQVVRVPMSKSQMEVYNYIEGTLPRSLRAKIWSNLPPSKKESKKLNAYMQGMRQVSNTAAPFVKEGSYSNKLDKMVQDLQTEVDKKGKVLVYSNYLDAGVDKFKERLNKRKIPYAHLTGSMSKGERAKAVTKYNTPNKTNVFLMSGAGAEGLNLPGTSLVQLTEPHWNKARLYQAASRGIRRGDDPKRTVNVKTYLSTIPEKKSKLSFLGFKPKKPRTSADEYLLGMSKRKQLETNSFMKALED